MMKQPKPTQMEIVDSEYAAAAQALLAGWHPQPIFGQQAEASARMKAKIEARRRRLEVQEK